MLNRQYLLSNLKFADQIRRLSETHSTHTQMEFHTKYISVGLSDPALTQRAVVKND